MTADTSQNPGLFVNSGQFTMTKLGSALNMTGLFGLDLDYWHSISLNISAYQPGQVIWFKTTVSDNVNATIEIPSAFSSFNNQKYFAIRIN